MARETKVGLLAGLAFIICFAVILSNRGRSDYLAPQSWLPGESEGQRQPAARSVEPFSQGRASGDPAAQPSGFTISPTGQIVFNTGAGGPAPIVSYDRGAQPWSSAEHAALQSMTEPVVPPPADPNAQRALEEHLARLSAGNGSLPAPASPAIGGPTTSDATQSAQTVSGSVPPSSVEPAARPTAGAVEYVVRAGDTLSKIAESHYRTRSKRMVDAIIDANRGRLANPNEIKVGMSLILPKLEGESGGPKVQRTAHSEVSAPPNSPKADASQMKGKGGFRWYQVRKDDRYASIAREQLGNDARWHEIFELNKDKFPDPNQIREGVRIKIPTTN
jgi:nucleoid-associated protein YgaU